MSKTYTRSFGGGEISPLLFGRLDLAKNQTGLALCENFQVTPQGPVENRTGFEYVIATRSSGSAPPALLPFTFNAEQSFALEFGDEYIRFHTAGATLAETSKPITAVTNALPGVFTSAGHGFLFGRWVFLSNMGGMPELSGRWLFVSSVPTADTFALSDVFGNVIDTSGMGAYTGGGTVAGIYEINSPYAVEDVFDLHYVQSADVLTITHRNYTPRELRRLGATNWTLTEIAFAPSLAPPAAPTAEARGPGGGTPIVHTYAVTALATATLEESKASASVAVNNDLTVTGNYNLVQPQAVTGAVRFSIYKQKSGIFGFVGQSDGSAFRDDNIEPDLTKTPPLAANPFAVGAIVSVPVISGGSGYLSSPSSGGEITSVTVTNPGSGYATDPAVTALGAGGTGSGAVLTSATFGGQVASITVTNAGSGYVSPVAITISSGTGIDATATAVSNPVVDNTVRAEVSDSGGPGSGALIQPVVVGGAIVGVQVLAAGAAYVSPTVTITNAAGGTGGVMGTPVITGADVDPQAVSYYEQRRVFAGTAGNPQTVWASRSGTESNMTYSIPQQDDDAITARIVAREGQIVRHLVPFNDLLAFTSGGVWRIASSDGGPLTGPTFSVKPQTYVGASNVQPVVTSVSVLYAPDRGSHLRELEHRSDGGLSFFQNNDISVLAPHLVDRLGIVQLAYSRTPYQVLWAVRSDGTLLGLTHQPEHDVRAWHRHTTAGLFKSVCVVPEGDDDALYAIVLRQVGALSYYLIERLHARDFLELRDCFFVDSGVTYDGAPATVISGLDHHEGREVAILADGGTHPRRTVVGGRITLQGPASRVHVGLPYSSDFVSMPLAIEAAPAFGQGVLKNINSLALHVYQASGVKAGPSFTKLTEYPQRLVSQPFDTPPAMLTGIVPLAITATWQQEGSVCIRQDEPLPLTIVAMTLDVATGG